MSYNGVNYNQGEPIAITSGNFTASYLGSTSSLHNIAFTVTNANAIPISHSDDVNITFNNVDFNLATAGDSSLYVGNSDDFNIYLSQLQNDASTLYTATYNIASGSVGAGNITTRASAPITLGQSYSIILGTTSMNFTATKVGLVLIDVTVTDSNNQSHTSQVTFNVENIDFTFSGAPQQNTIEVRETTSLNFNITEPVTSGAVYQMKYEVVSGNGNVIDGNSTQLVNTYYNVNTGAYSWEFEAINNGNVELLFTTRNMTTNVEYTQMVNITVNEPPVNDFSFTAIGSANSTTVEQSVPVNFNITETVGNSTYSMVFSSTSTGTFTYNGVDYLQGQPISVSPGNFTGAYKSSTVDTHNITFTVTNANTIPVSHNSGFSITYNLLDFTFSGAAQQNTIETGGESTFLNFNISEIFVSGNDYEMKYEVINGSGNVKDGGLVKSVNTFFNVNTGSYSWEFESTNSGNIELLFTVRNITTRVTHTQTINVTVTDPPASDFSFTAIGSTNSETVGQAVLVNLNITETIGNSAYSMVFTSSGTGSLEYNGSTYVQGQPIAVTAGNFTGIYNSTTANVHDIIFTVTNDNTTPISRSDTISISFNSIDFTLSTVGDGSLFKNSEKDFYTIISQENNDNTITYKIRFSIIGGSTGNGQIYTDVNSLIPLGSYHNGFLDVGSSSFRFQGLSNGGDVELLVEVMDSNGIIKSSSLYFVVEDVPYVFDAAAQDGSTELGNSTDIFFNVTEAAVSFTNYEIKYQITSAQTAQISNDGTVVNPNTYIPIDTGSTSWTFTGTEVGDISILFTIRNTNTLSLKAKTININVTKIPSDFTFTAISSVNNAIVNTCPNINFNLTETTGNSTYSMVFTTSSSGTFTYNGTIYNQGQPITVVPGNFIGCYTGTTAGLDHDVEFIVRNSEDLSKDAEERIFIESEKNFEVSGAVNSATVIINDNVGGVNFNLHETVGNSSYSAVFKTTGGAGTLEYDGNIYTNGQTIPTFLINSSSGGTYYPTSEGNHLISFTVSNSEVPIKSKTFQTFLNVTQSMMDINFSRLSYYQSDQGLLSFDVEQAGLYTINISPQTTENGYFCNPSAIFCVPGFGAYELSTDITLSLNSGVNTINFTTNKSYDVTYDISISDGVNTVSKSFEIVVDPLITSGMGYTRYESSNGVLTSCITSSGVYLGAITSYSTKVRAYMNTTAFLASGGLILIHMI
ncbi:fibronectin type III domain protein [Algibacter lectus]|uniref:Fibronectin type III domain protein n=1 Tax=Algibacter lectus TaxID=221126 RepID=A0A090X483_9FLAO|nr:hypothetical protein [Algibacter lectus]GAL77332.1 fibronectin type III domain protein [Algibacter lectus]